VLQTNLQLSTADKVDSSSAAIYNDAVRFNKLAALCDSVCSKAP